MGIPKKKACISYTRSVPVGLGLHIYHLRKHLKLTQAEFASRYGLELVTVQNWEQGKCLPTGPAVTLLHLIIVNPHTIAEMITKLR